jgi:hypothetical protein
VAVPLKRASTSANDSFVGTVKLVTQNASLWLKVSSVHLPEELPENRPSLWVWNEIVPLGWVGFGASDLSRNVQVTVCRGGCQQSPENEGECGQSEATRKPCGRGRRNEFGHVFVPVSAAPSLGAAVFYRVANGYIG